MSARWEGVEIVNSPPLFPHSHSHHRYRYSALGSNNEMSLTATLTYKASFLRSVGVEAEQRDEKPEFMYP
jgi:hypothetical protein